MIIRQSGIFRKGVKRLSPSQKLQLDEAIRKIVANPESGEKVKLDYTYQYNEAPATITEEIMG